jgi:hypothetical protein
VIRRSFRLGLWLGLLGGITYAVLRLVQSNRETSSVAPAAQPAPAQPWPRLDVEAPRAVPTPVATPAATVVATPVATATPASTTAAIGTPTPGPYGETGKSGAPGVDDAARLNPAAPQG